MHEPQPGEEEQDALPTPEERITLLTDALKQHPGFNEAVAELESVPEAEQVEFLEEQLEMLAVAQLIKERQRDGRPTISAEELISRFDAQGYIDERGGRSPWMLQSGTHSSE